MTLSLTIAGVVVVAVIIFWMMKKKKKGGPIAPKGPSTPPPAEGPEM